MLDRLELINRRYDELNEEIALPEVSTDPKRLGELSRERANLEDVVKLYRKYRITCKELAEAETLLDTGTEVTFVVVIFALFHSGLRRKVTHNIPQARIVGFYLQC